MQYVFDSTTTKGSQRLMLLAIADRCDDEGTCYPGIKYLAKKCNVTKKNARNLVQKLEEIGEIMVVENGGIKVNGGETNKYVMAKYCEQYKIPISKSDFREVGSESTPRVESGSEGTPESGSEGTPESDPQSLSISQEYPKDIAPENFENSIEQTIDKPKDIDADENSQSTQDQFDTNSDILITSVSSASNTDLFDYDLVKWIRLQNRSAGKKLIRSFESKLKAEKKYGLDNECSALDMYDNDVVYQKWCDQEYKRLHDARHTQYPLSVEDIVKLVTDDTAFFTWQEQRRTAIEGASEDYDLAEADAYTQSLLGINLMEDQDEA
jgi:hypothetical protein